jgi:hypothetical protein
VFLLRFTSLASSLGESSGLNDLIFGYLTFSLFASSLSSLFIHYSYYYYSVDTAVAETVVYRQRQVDHKYRSNPSGHATAMQDMMFPVLVKEMK